MKRADFIVGTALDLVIGDPHWLPHPVGILGTAITKTEGLWRATGIPLRLAGAGHTLSIVALATGIAWATLPRLNLYWVWSLLAIRSLDKETHASAERVLAADLDGARAKLSMVVGRDTAELDERAILRALLETLSENFSDAVVAPLFWLVLTGPAGMAGFKAASTLDSMVGYKNERYRRFGTSAARLDDALNCLPARLSALIIAVAALPLGLRWRDAIRIAARDGTSQPSPNSGFPEAAFAGALGVRLGGVSSYAGIPSLKAFIGDDCRPIELPVYREARLLYWTSCAVAIALAWAVMD